MPVFDIVKIGNPVLRKKCQCVKLAQLKTEKFHRFLDSMVKTMRAAGGVGLAANQTAIQSQVIVLECQNNQRYPKAQEFSLEIFINPRILKYSKEKVLGWEGCLSIPGYRGKVPRSKKVTFQAITPEGKKVVKTVQGFHARVIQHEVDHIEGKFYIDRMTDFSSWMHLDEFNKKFHTRINK